MGRKSMIEPTLPRGQEVAGESILGRIIAHDREQSGRSSPDDTAHFETNVTTLQRSPEVTNELYTPHVQEDENSPETSPMVLATNLLPSGAFPAPANTVKKTAQKRKPSPQTNMLEDTWEERQAVALKRVEEDEIAVVTVRAPQKLNSYIDRYIERVNRIAPKRRYRKQDAVAEMFAWFYASHPMPPAPDEEDL